MEPVTARTNETGRRATGMRRRVLSTVAMTVLILCVPASAPAKNGGQLPPGQAKKLAPAPSAQVVAAPPGQAKKAAQKAAKKATKKATKKASAGQVKKAARLASPAQATTPIAQASRLAARAVPPGQAKKAAGGAAPAQGQVRKAARAASPGQARKAARAATRARAAFRARAAARRRAATRRRLGARSARASAVNLPAALAAPALAATQTRSTTTTAAPRAASGAAPVTRTTAAPHHVATTSKPRSQRASSRGPVRTVTRTVTRTVRDIAHVIPGWAKALMAALGVLLAVAGALILAAAYRNRRLRAQRAALLADVGALQAALLPVVPDRVGALRVSVAYRPAEGLAAGGDFYDVFPLDDDGRVGLLVGDVSGHGRESLPAATFTRHMVRAYLEAGLAPREALQVAGRVVDQQKRDDVSATLIAAVHAPTAGPLSYASAGHPPPIVLGPAAHEPMIVGSSPPLGVDSATGLRQTTLPLPAGSTVYLFTDGLFEARRGTAILGRKRVAELLAELGPDGTARDLVDRVERDSDAIRDDVAVCIMHVDGDTSATGTVRVEELEVQAGEIDGSRVRRFLEGAGVDPAEMGSVMAAARKRAATDGSVLLRVRLARDRSGVDVLPARADGAAAPVAALSARRAA